MLERYLPYESGGYNASKKDKIAHILHVEGKNTPSVTSLDFLYLDAHF